MRLGAGALRLLEQGRGQGSDQGRRMINSNSVSGHYQWNNETKLILTRTGD